MTTARDNPVITEAVYQVPVADLWKAITDHNQLKQWYFDIPSFRLIPGFEFEFYGEGKSGEKFLHRCRITELVENKLLRHTWQYEGYPGLSMVSFELFDEGNQSRLKLTHEGLDSFPVTANDDFNPANFKEGWSFLTGVSLKKFLET